MEDTSSLWMCLFISFERAVQESMGYARLVGPKVHSVRGIRNLGFISCRADDRYPETRGDEQLPLVSSRAFRKRFNLEGVQGIPTVSRGTIFSYLYLSRYRQPTPGYVEASPASLNSAVMS